MTAAVRALLAPFYWLAVVVFWLAVTPLLCAPLASLHGWQANLAGVATGMVVPAVSMLAKRPVLNCCTRHVTRLVENFAAEWRKLLATPTLPPTGGENDGHDRPATGRILP